MTELICSKTCCSACYCPLVLAWATTIHKFQVFEAGFDENDTINYILADINTLNWKKTTLEQHMELEAELRQMAISQKIIHIQLIQIYIS